MIKKSLFAATILILLLVAGMVVSPSKAVLLNTGLYSSVAENEWEFECIDCPKSIAPITDHSFTLDTTGQPHVAYGGDHLYYAWFNNSSSNWHIQIVDNVNAVGASLSLDTNGYPHISYVSSGNLKYAYQDALGWHTQIVNNEGGWSTSLALDQNGYPRIAYDYSGLKYAYQDAGGWHTQSVDSTGDIDDPSLALDTSGYAYISYYDTVNDNLKYAYQDNVGWHIQTLDSTGDVGRFSSLVLDTNNSLHISYLDQTNHKVKYIYRHGSSTTVQNVGPIGLSGACQTSVALSSLGTPFISYFNSDNESPMYAYKDETGWHTQIVSGTYGELCSGTSMIVDEDGYLHIIHLDTIDLTDFVRYSYKDTSGWHTQSVDNEERIYNLFSMLLDKQGYAHVIYSSYTNQKYAYQDNLGWHSENLNMGAISSLALDDQNYPHISSYYGYWDPDMYRPEGELIYSYQDSTGWYTETVDTEDDAGHDSSLVLRNTN